MLKITTVLLLALGLRLFGLQWDQGLHLHPDERMLIMVANRIHFFNNLDPNFFSYGSLPIYFLKGITQLLDFFLSANIANYDRMLYLGRSLSVFADMVVVLLIFKISYNLFRSTKIALVSSLFYSISFFPIQNSHFFIADTFLNLFITLLMYFLIRYYHSKKNGSIVIMGIIAASALATKITAVIFLPIVALVIILTRKNALPIMKHLLLFLAVFVLFLFVFMPYAFLSSNKFIQDISLQMKMNSNPYVFPYTLQYVGTLPYFYYLKNIFLWGLGPIISMLGMVGVIGVIRGIRAIGGIREKRLIIFFLLFYTSYFIILGQTAVKFMRYMLPMYPFFAILAGYGLYKVQGSKFKIKSYNFNFKLLAILIVITSVVWTISFVNIYTKKHTRIVASNWILKNIPAGSTLAIEHWDDSLPLYGQEQYKVVEMTLYDRPDNDYKWQKLKEKLQLADYIIIASNRLYVPLQKIKDCQKYKVCFPKTAKYYERLFRDNRVILNSFQDLKKIPNQVRNDERVLKFEKVTEFTSYPELKILNLKLTINDDDADESFTVYDHPKIMIFKRTSGR